ncbi:MULTISPECIES: ABC-three component system middle component 2 [unclassified Mesorhizobium]|uniref:ABC-three component system middle component 2 n=2 Tax=Mesorhizobium TaxID=68287 RepID=UPI001FE1FF3D|nr:MULTISPECIES: ABC-three component system middle component 2 [unclassified Mesorhizobium]
MVPAMNPHAEGSSPSRPYNSPLECGLRMLFVLEASGKPADLQRLISYDYLLVHSGDVADGPESLHPSVPYRGSELLVKREVLSAGLNQMFARELIAKTFDTSGILYRATELTSAFVALLKTHYAEDLRQRSIWVIDKFGGMQDAELNSLMSSNVGRWGAEFERLSAIKDLEL